MINIKELKPHPNNLKKHPESQITTLIKLIEMVGFKDPIVIDKKFNIKAGHGRLEAAKKLKMKNVPCIYIEGLTQKQMDLFMYLDNHVNESPWIQDNIDLIFQDIPLIDLEQFPEINWENIIPQPEINEGPIPEKPAKPKSKLGQIYELGRHKVICGDALKPESFESLLEKKIAVISFTSPPYNIGKTEKKYENSNDSLSDDDYLEFLVNFTMNTINFSEYSFVDLQFLATNKVVFIKFLNELKDHLVDKMVWDKQHGQPPRVKNVMNTAFEDIFIFSNKIKAKKRQIDTADFHGTVENIYHGHSNTRNEFAEIHMAAFPTDLPQHFITTFSKKNDIVLDPFLGTGSTLIAAESSNRICYGIELDPGYVDVIIQRWENFTKKKARLIN